MHAHAHAPNVKWSPPPLTRLRGFIRTRKVRTAAPTRFRKNTPSAPRTASALRRLRTTQRSRTFHPKLAFFFYFCRRWNKNEKWLKSGDRDTLKVTKEEEKFFHDNKCETSSSSSANTSKSAAFILEFGAITEKNPQSVTFCAHLCAEPGRARGIWRTR